MVTPLNVPATQAPAEFPQVPGTTFSAFGSLSGFRDAQRMATMLAHSSIVPERFRGDEHLADCVIALEIANRIGMSILAVMQNLRLVQGNFGWSSQFLISCINASGRFSPIRYRKTGTRGQDDWGCVAWVIDRSSERLESPEVTIRTAKEEGWYERPGSKWKTMPELMLCYRSATLLARLYAPEITMGIQTTDEVVDTGADAVRPLNRPVFKKRPSHPQFEAKPELDRTGEPVTHPDGTPPGIREAQDPQPASDKAARGSLAGITSTSEGTRYDYLKALTGLIGLSTHSEDSVLGFLCRTRRCEDSVMTLAELAAKQPEALVWAHDHWQSVERELSRLEKGAAL